MNYVVKNCPYLTVHSKVPAFLNYCGRHYKKCNDATCKIRQTIDICKEPFNDSEAQDLAREILNLWDIEWGLEE